MRAFLFVVALIAPSLARAETVESMAANIITSRGYWCARVADVIPDRLNSTPNRTVLTVACDDGREYARYQLTIARDGSGYTVKEL
ncbi:hypothetical protein AH2_0009 [Burkholderia phage vB_BceS_AH2]|uniref:Uncharacterized protein n=1 Tax=Burkholderia phage vB_BceS_AH2 TaxID=1133022 RepID=I6NLH6_9CAUD|nr:hypothetical protein B613_gp09 [Burkholderia phage vB_BceS_AH2]AEY69520.1 hypothetical protein AH2_0009 [Burkholderia phage vB_BceS_AH2]